VTHRTITADRLAFVRATVVRSDGFRQNGPGRDDRLKDLPATEQVLREIGDAN
jgi:hypothetical protein